MTWVLHLPSWYPTEKRPFWGIFIQRQIQAIGRVQPSVVVRAYADTELPFAEERRQVLSPAPGLSEIHIAYGKPKTLVEQIKRWFFLKRLYRREVEALLAERGRPIGLHVHVSWPIAPVALDLHHRLGIPFIITEHWSGFLPEDGQYRGWLKWFVKPLYQKAVLALLASQKAENAMRNHGFYLPTRWVPSVVDTDLFFPAKNPDFSTWRFIHVSSLVEREKNVAALLLAFAAFAKNKTDVALHIAGPKAQWKLLVETLDSSLFNKVHYEGSLPPEKLAAVYRRCHCLVLPSHFEGQPNVVLEAWASGLPVLASAVGFLPETMCAAKGILLNGTSAEAIQAGLETMYAAFHQKSIAFPAIEAVQYIHQHHHTKAVADFHRKVYANTFGA